MLNKQGPGKIDWYAFFFISFEPLLEWPINNPVIIAIEELANESKTN